MDITPGVISGKRLVDWDIVDRLSRADESRIIITPILFAEEQIGSVSINLHLGTEFIATDRASNTHYDPLWSREEFSDFATKVHRIKRINPSDYFVVHPKQFVLATTLEYIRLPADIVGDLDGRSIWARQGLEVHSTASVINPGSSSVITFELQNVEDIPIKLYPGMPIGQLSFFELASVPWRSYDSKRKRGKYLHHVQAEKGLYCEDIEMDILRRLKNRRNKTECKTK
jgi:dCTP deaminase